MPEPKIIEPISFLKSEIHKKAWGQEEWVVNNDLYCLKFLTFKKGKSFSFHYHSPLGKTETWILTKGHMKLNYLDLSNANKLTVDLLEGDIVHIPGGNPHKLTAYEDSVIVEVSTPHRDFDSYRIEPGDSQK